MQTTEGAPGLRLETVEVGDRTHRASQPQPQDRTIKLRVGVLSCRLMGWMLTFLAVMDQREREQGVPSDVLEQWSTHDVPDPSIAERESKALDQPVNDDRGAFTERPSEIPPEHASEGGYISQSAGDTAYLSGKDGGEGRSPNNPTVCVNLYQFQGENLGIQYLGSPLFPPMLRKKQNMDSVRLKLPSGPSPTSALFARFVDYSSPQTLLQTCLQETIFKAEDLVARVDALEKHFDSPPSNVLEQRHRSEVIRYVIISPHCTRC